MRPWCIAVLGGGGVEGGFVAVEQRIEVRSHGSDARALGIAGEQSGRWRGNQVRSATVARLGNEELFQPALAEVSEQGRRGSPALAVRARAGLFREALDVLENMGLFVADFADEVEVFEFAFLLLVLAGDRALREKLLEEVVALDFLAFGEELRVRAEHFDEGMNLRLGGFAELDQVVACSVGKKLYVWMRSSVVSTRLTRPTRWMRRVGFHGMS